jgi:hypothetical protein
VVYNLKLFLCAVMNFKLPWMSSTHHEENVEDEVDGNVDDVSPSM